MILQACDTLFNLLDVFLSFLDQVCNPGFIVYEY